MFCPAFDILLLLLGCDGLVFSSLYFLFLFLPAVLLLLLLTPPPGRNYVLLLVNLVFYAYGEPVYVLLMLASIAVNYALALLIERSLIRRKFLLCLTVILNLGALGVFKYAGLFSGTLNRFFPAVPVLSLPLPIGISFYTFQAMSYVIDVYRGECPAEKNFAGFAAYISLFPQLIAGPIVRYADVREQLAKPVLGAERTAMGVRLFVIGLAKKVLLANQLGLLWNAAAPDPAAVGTLGAWLALAAFALQLYFDFSGYSDMARGLGAMLGFEFCVNFDYPYLSRSITEFWRRWHISLSSWFRDYVYFPLGGSRCRTVRMCFNLLVTWILTGLWHGAGWNFLFWGLYYGLLLILEKLVWKKWLDMLPAVFQHVYTLFLVLIGWVFFASESFAAAGAYLRVLFSPCAGNVPGGVLSWVPLGLSACFAASPLGAKLWRRFAGKFGVWEAAAVLAALALCTACLVSDSYNPFLYFRF